MNTLKIVPDDHLELKRIYGLDHYYYEFNQDKFSSQIVVCVNVLEHFNNIELLKLSIWCKRKGIRIVAYGNLNEFPLFGIFADAAILLPTNENSIYEGSTTYQCKSEVLDQITSESLYFPARVSFLNQRHWEINGIGQVLDSSGEFIGCHVINVCRSNYDQSTKPVHFLLDIASREVSDEEVVDIFSFPRIHIRKSSLEIYESLKKEGEIGANWVIGEIKRGDSCGGEHLKSILESKTKGYELEFILDIDTLDRLQKKCSSNYMEVQVLSSFLSNWMWICYGGSSNIFSFFPVKVLSLSDSMCLPDLCRKLSVARFGDYLGGIFPEFDTLIYCMPGEEDGPSRTDGERPLPNFRKMIVDFSKVCIEFKMENAEDK